MANYDYVNEEGARELIKSQLSSACNCKEVNLLDPYTLDGISDHVTDDGPNPGNYRNPDFQASWSSMNMYGTCNMTVISDQEFPISEAVEGIQLDIASTSGNTGGLAVLDKHSKDKLTYLDKYYKLSFWVKTTSEVDVYPVVGSVFDYSTFVTNEYTKPRTVNASDGWVYIEDLQKPYKEASSYTLNNQDYVYTNGVAGFYAKENGSVQICGVKLVEATDLDLTLKDIEDKLASACNCPKEENMLDPYALEGIEDHLHNLDTWNPNTYKDPEYQKSWFHNLMYSGPGETTVSVLKDINFPNEKIKEGIRIDSNSTIQMIKQTPNGIVEKDKYYVMSLYAKPNKDFRFSILFGGYYHSERQYVIPASTDWQHLKYIVKSSENINPSNDTRYVKLFTVQPVAANTGTSTFDFCGMVIREATDEEIALYDLQDKVSNLPEIGLATTTKNGFIPRIPGELKKVLNGNLTWVDIDSLVEKGLTEDEVESLFRDYIDEFQLVEKPTLETYHNLGSQYRQCKPIYKDDDLNELTEPGVYVPDPSDPEKVVLQFTLDYDQGGTVYKLFLGNAPTAYRTIAEDMENLGSPKPSFKLIVEEITPDVLSGGYDKIIIKQTFTYGLSDPITYVRYKANDEWSEWAIEFYDITIEDVNELFTGDDSENLDSLADTLLGIKAKIETMDTNISSLFNRVNNQMVIKNFNINYSIKGDPVSKIMGQIPSDVTSQNKILGLAGINITPQCNIIDFKLTNNDFTANIKPIESTEDVQKYTISVSFFTIPFTQYSR